MQKNTLIVTKNGAKLLVDKTYGDVYLCFVLDSNNKKVKQEDYNQKHKMGICTKPNVLETYAISGN